ncbi:ABC transporter ATP-binding protein [Micromonospora inaquosa]|uniref:ABC transporter ATP-binding protein n=1 Tax=Micromonospora inaquosa TaxID=2203716 RepID=A0A3N9WZX0_9ACTN|nr:ABC transporter ATP-binding protein [Micromonospora inaquosa]RQX06381.1 ABC transporter ATP-binding protein [Micromonospora inaquosa]
MRRTARILGRSPLTALLGYVRPHAGSLLAGAALMFLGGVVTLAQPLVVKHLLDALTTGTPYTRPMFLLGGLLLVSAVAGVCGMYLLECTAESVVLTVRRRLIAQLLRLRVRVLDDVEPGDLLSRVTGDTTQLRAATTSNVVDLVAGSIQLVGAVVLMARLDGVLLTVVVLVLLVLGAVLLALVPRIRDTSLRAQEEVGGMGAVLERALGALRTVKANGAEERQVAAVHALAGRAWQRGRQAAQWTSVAGIATGLAVQLAFLVVLGVGGARVAAGQLAVSSLIAFLLYLFYLTGPATQVVGSVTGLQAGLAAARRIEQLGQLPAEDLTRPAEGRAPDDGVPASVTFHAVSLRHHPGGPPILRDVDLRIPATGLTALVGPSGGGKTTLLALVERFYDPTRGRVEIDGRDVRDWPLAELRARIGYVEQDAPVLSGTLRDNLLLGTAGGVPEDWMAAVLERTRLASLVQRLPHGLDTVVGHRGAALSGGERQRVAVARAILRQPGLLLLDEPTSQLDAVNEQALRELVTALARTTTVLMVAHRLSTVIRADRIVLVEGGRIRAVGTHAQLLAGDVLYRRLATTQLLAEPLTVGVVDSRSMEQI